MSFVFLNDIILDSKRLFCFLDERKEELLTLPLNNSIYNLKKKIFLAIKIKENKNVCI